MKNIIPIIFISLLGFINYKMNGQSASTYTFTATTATYSNLTGTTNVGGLGNTSDDVLSNTTNIGFTFNFAGTDYTQFKVSSNGFITFNTASTDSFFLNSEANAGTNKPVLMPLWDDLRSTSRVRYRLDGNAPDRIMKIEFRGNRWDYQASGDAIKFQVWLYETSNRIEFHYQQSPASLNNPSATIGIYDANDTYLTLDSAGASPTASSSTFTTTIDAKPANNQVYRFDPPTDPVITVSATSLPSFEACNLTVSSSQTFQVSGILLTDDILITALTGFEVSTDDVSFSDSLVLTQSGGNVATTTIYARMKALSSNPTPATIDLTSTGATTRNVSVSGVLISPTGVSAGTDVSICASSPVVLDGSADYDAAIQTLSTIDGDTGFATMITNDTNRWSISATTNAGGSANELRMQWFTGGDPTPVSIWVQSPLLDASDLTNLSMNFKHNLDWFAGNAPLAMQTSSDGVTWTTRWSQTATGDVAATTVTVDLSAVNQSAFYYRFLYDGNIYNIDNWYIDDIIITGNFVEPTYSWTSIPSGFTSTLQDPTVNPSVTTTYILEVTLNGCTITDEVVVSVESTTWNGSSWSNGIPTATTAAVIEGDFTSNASLDACSLLVTNNANVTISSGDSVTLSGDLTVDSGSSFNMSNNSNLIQSEDAVNTGAISVNRQTADLMRLDYVLWGSPVDNQNLLAFSPQTVANRFYTYNSSTNQYNTITPSTNSFALGSGYLIRLPNNHPTSPTAWTGIFTGVPNNGDVVLSVVEDTYNAVGNPYPSTVDADEFISQNNISEALYFWRKTNNANTSSYATYTLAGGAGSGSNSGDPLGIIPNGVIQIGQGFIVRSTSNQIQFNNSMRIIDNQNQFLRASNTRSRIWLNIIGVQEMAHQTMIAYMPGSTLGEDAGYDGRYFNDSPNALTSLIGETEYAVQARGEFEATDEVPLGFKTQTAGNYTISIGNLDGLFTGEQNIYLRDLFFGTVHDLKASAYTFSSDVGTFNERFRLVFQNTLSTPNVNESNNLIAFVSNRELMLDAGSELMSDVKIYDVRGSLVFEAKPDTTNFNAYLPVQGKQILLVQVTFQNGTTVTKKVAY